MFQSSLHQPASPGIHVAIIMDGSGRWARRRGLPRPQGHRAGVEAVRRVIAGALRFGVGTLTLHAFSSDNWQRCPEEVVSLFRIFEEFLRNEPLKWIAQGVQVRVIGRRDRMPFSLREAIESAEDATAAGRSLSLRLAIDYSARQTILRAAGRLIPDAEPSEADFCRMLAEASGSRDVIPEVDLLIRTGGEQRLSDFMLWECAYAELYFTPCLWPDFTAEDFESAIRDFHSRDRRFGRTPEAAAV
ncbi:MAG: polyprenyl diphosphate synthase [Acidobacteria bacterium]|nr:polyprenyl diphosphate synthase [Acidobacteriota bacterium]